jgi:hypothetical protein
MKAPALAPATPVDFRGAPPEPIRLALEHLTAVKTWRWRRYELPTLRKRRRRVVAGGPMEVYTPGLAADRSADLDGLRQPRGDLRAGLQRLLGCIVQHAAVSNGLAGKWTVYVDKNGKERPLYLREFSRHEWAARAGITVDEFDDYVSILKCGYIDRRQRRRKERDEHGQWIYKGCRATLLLKEQFWRELGAAVWNARQKHLAQKKAPPRPEEQGTEPAEPVWSDPEERARLGAVPPEQAAAEAARTRATWPDE